MRSELIKVKSMPTPFWCGVAILAGFLLGFAVTFWKGLGEDAAAVDLAIAFPTAIASMVFGVWVYGVEFGQNTMRRVLTADPGRARLILVKLAVTVLLVAGITMLLHLLALPLYNLAASGHDQSLSVETALRYGAAATLSNLVSALIGAAFALITFSMAGGITLTLIFLFVIDSVLSIVPRLEEASLGSALTVLTEAIRGFEDEIFGGGPSHTEPVAALIVAGWLVVLLGLGAFRLMRAEVK